MIQLGLVNVRPNVRRAFYEATYGNGGMNVTHSKRAFAEATFEEYLALMRVLYPTTTARIVASQAFFSPDFRALEKTLPEERKVSRSGPEPVVWEPPKKRPPSANMIELRSLKGIDGEKLRIPALQSIFARLSKGVVRETKTPVDVVAIDVSECEASFVDSLFAATSAREIVWIEFRKTPINLAWVAGHPKLRSLIARGPAVLNVSSLAQLSKLDVLDLSRVRVGAPLAASLSSLPLLTDLALVTADAIAPADIPFASLPKLRRVRVSAHPAEREAWLRFACDRPEIGFVFEAPPAAAKALPAIDVAESHRDIEILSVGSGKKVKYRIESDVADTVGYEDGNGDLEDSLAAIAKKSKKKVTWASEADTLVATCADLATCRWIVDEAYALAGGKTR